MKAYPWNKGWYYRHADENETENVAITIPHDAMLAEKRYAGAPSGKNAGWFEGKDYIYTKYFDVEESDRDKKILFEFEGVYKNASVYINGIKAAHRPYGYSNFYADTDGLLKYGEENKIEVFAFNSDQPNSRWYSGAGIYRPVTMWKAPKNYILPTGIKIRTLRIDPAEIEVCVKTKGEGILLVRIYDARGNCVVQSEPYQISSEEKTSISLRVPNAELWSPDSPNLYRCHVVFGEDEHVESFGIRTLEWGEKGMLINGERVILRGACIHHDNGLLGAAAYKDAEWRKIRILKENGYNAVRSAHNPCSKELLAACDEMGMLVMDEFVDCWYIHKTKYDYVNYFEKWWKKDLESMVEKDYNHPSVILYSTGNEVSETAQKRGIELTGQMTEYLHSLDSTRPVSCGVNIFFNFLSSVGFGVYSDKKAEKESDTKKKKAVGSEFFNNLAGLLGDNTMKIGATLPPCDWKTKDAFANMDIAGYNYGIYRYRHDLKKYPDRLILGSETFCKDAYRFYQLAQKEPRIIGDFVWAGMDYLGEVGIGSWEYDDYAENFDSDAGWISAGSGRIDLTGNPLAEAAYTKVAFGMEKNPVIAVRPVNHTKDKHSPSAWKMSNAIESWAWNGCDGKEAYIEVYGNGAEVELFINDKSFGRKKLKECRTHFEAKWEQGKIKAVLYDLAGKEIGNKEMHSAGEETFLKLKEESRAFSKDNLVYVWMTYTDADGMVKPLERGKIHVEVENGKLLALGTACPFNKDGYLNAWTGTYYGRALAIIQVQEEDIKIKADDGIHKAELTINVKKEA